MIYIGCEILILKFYLMKKNFWKNSFDNTRINNIALPTIHK